jgi:hypothetical protein
MLQQVCPSPSSPLSYLPLHLYLHVPAHRFCSLHLIPLEKKKKSDLKALKMMGGGGGGGAVGAASLSMASSSAGTPIPSRPVRTDTDSAYVQTQTVCTNRYLLSSVCLTTFHSFSRLFFSLSFFDSPVFTVYPTPALSSTTSFWLSGPIRFPFPPLTFLRPFRNLFFTFLLSISVSVNTVRSPL